MYSKSYWWQKEKKQEENEEVTAKQCLETLHGEDQEVASQYKDLCRDLMKDGWQVCRNLKRLFFPSEKNTKQINKEENKKHNSELFSVTGDVSFCSINFSQMYIIL